jgi:hypothetical protein
VGWVAEFDDMQNFESRVGQIVMNLVHLIRSVSLKGCW